MENAVDMTYQVVQALFGVESGVPGWAWLAPLVMIFGKLLMPVLVPEAAGSSSASGASSRKGKKNKKGKKGK